MAQILKALYGLIQSAVLWFNVLISFLSSIGFRSNLYDNCVMRRKTEYGTMLLILYVDDILVLSDDERDNHWLIHELEKEYGTISVDLKDSFTYLGMVLKKESNGEIQVYIPGYIQMMLSEYEKRRNIKSYTTRAAIYVVYSRQRE